MDTNFSDNKYTIDINNDCWECIFSKMDWTSWSNFCDTFPGFKSMNHKIQKTFLTIDSLQTPRKSLSKNFHRVRKAIIMADLSTDFPKTSRDYLQLTTLQHLIVTYINKPIDFISSTHIKKLMVSPLQNALRIDYVEPILQLSSKIQSFKYFHGILDMNSIMHLNRNPIRNLYLYDVPIIAMERFTEFLSNNNHLTSVTLMGRKDRSAQVSFFSENNSSLPQIKYLKFSVQERLLTHYQTLERCTNLEKIIIEYKSYKHAEYIYTFLFNLPKLKEIQILLDHIHSSDSIPNSFNHFQRQFKSQHIRFSEYIYPLFNKRVDEIRI